MKQFLIKYHFKNGSEEEWHKEISRFVYALNNDPALSGKISYRCMKNSKSSDYYHLASTTDEEAVKTLQSKDFFKHYTAQNKIVSDGSVEVIPLEIIAETKPQS